MIPGWKSISTIKIFIIAICCLFTVNAYAVHWFTKSIIRLVDLKTMRPASHDFFTRFDPPYLHNSKIIFRGFSGRKKAGIYTNLYGDLQVIVNTDTTPANDRREFRAFGHRNRPGTSNLPVLHENKIAFFGNGYGNGLTGIYSVVDNKLLMIANEETIIPGGAKGLFTYFYDPAFIGKDQIAFIGKGKKGLIGIYSGTGDKEQNIKTLLDNNTSIPNSRYNFQNFSELAFSRNNLSENFAFIGIDEKKQFGLYFFHKETLLKIADQSTEIPNGTGYFKNIDNVIFDDHTQQIMFVGKGILGQSGIYLYGKGKLIQAVDQQDVIPETDDKFNHIYTASMDNGLIAFYAEGHKKNEGIYLYTPDGIFTILTKHDSVNKKEIKKISLTKGALSNNQLALNIEFEDDDQAIYLITLEKS